MARQVSPSVFARRRAEHDPLQLADRRAAEAHRRLEALGAQVARVERGAQVVQRRRILLADLLLGGLQEDYVARPAQRMGQANPAIALIRAEPLDADDDGLARLEALGHR